VIADDVDDDDDDDDDVDDVKCREKAHIFLGYCLPRWYGKLHCLEFGTSSRKARAGRALFGQKEHTKDNIPYNARHSCYAVCTMILDCLYLS